MDWSSSQSRSTATKATSVDGFTPARRRTSSRRSSSCPLRLARSPTSTWLAIWPAFGTVTRSRAATSSVACSGSGVSTPSSRSVAPEAASTSASRSAARSSTGSPSASVRVAERPLTSASTRGPVHSGSTSASLMSAARRSPYSAGRHVRAAVRTSVASIAAIIRRTPRTAGRRNDRAASASPNRGTRLLSSRRDRHGPARPGEPERPGGRIARSLGALTPSGRASVPLSWAFYDFANTIYSYAVVSYAIGLWSVHRLGDSDGQFWVLFAGAASVLLNAVVSPVLGAMSDRTGGRMRYLLFFTAVTVVGSALIGFVDVAAMGLVLYAIANFGYQAALIYYDATLPIVAKPEARGRVSGMGVAIGYLGTIVIALLILVLNSKASGLTFLLAAGLFGVFSLPLFLKVREPVKADAQPFRLRDVAGSWQQLRRTVEDARKVPGLLRFLVGRFFYTDPVNTVIVIMSVFATQAIGISQSAANLVLLLLTVVAVVASFGWGQLVER